MLPSTMGHGSVAWRNVSLLRYVYWLTRTPLTMSNRSERRRSARNREIKPYSPDMPWEPVALERAIVSLFRIDEADEGELRRWLNDNGMLPPPGVDLDGLRWMAQLVALNVRPDESVAKSMSRMGRAAYAQVFIVDHQDELIRRGWVAVGDQGDPIIAPALLHAFATASYADLGGLDEDGMPVYRLDAVAKVVASFSSP